MRTFFLVFLFLAGCSGASGPAPDPDGFVEIFDGKTLAGWSAPDMSFFSVQDGAITGEATPKHLPPYNQFITWMGGTVRDFDFRFKFRVTGAKANSGMQFRSVLKEKGLVHGYQADIAMTGAFLGGIWDEYGPRKSLAARGESTVVDEDGKKTVTKFGDPAELVQGVNLAEWTDYRILAQGPHMLIEINGRKMSELVDRDRDHAAQDGVVAMPIIPEPMRIQFKDLRLKRL